MATAKNFPDLALLISSWRRYPGARAEVPLLERRCDQRVACIPGIHGKDKVWWKAYANLADAEAMFKDFRNYEFAELYQFVYATCT